MRAVAEFAVEAVRVQQRQEELEVFFLAGVWRGGHQQEVAGDGTQQFSKLETLGLVDLVAEVAGREFVGLVHDDQVPARQAQLFKQVFGTGELVNAGDQQVKVIKRVAAAGLFDLLAREQFKTQPKFFPHFVLPLLDQRAGGDDEHALGIGTHEQLADEQAGHDGFARAGVVSQHVAQRLTRQHGFVDGSNLVRQRLYVGRMHRHHRVKQVCQVDAPSLGSELESIARRIKSPRAPRLGQREVRFISAKQHPLAQRAIGGFVVDGQRVTTDWLGRDNADHLPRFQARDGSVLLDLFELQHATTPCSCYPPSGLAP